MVGRDPALMLQQKLEKIIFNFTVPHLDEDDLKNAIPDRFREQVALRISQVGQLKTGHQLKFQDQS